jgi:hypothetical protein
MDQETFLNEYADSRLIDWWDAAAPPVRAVMLDILTGLHATALTEMDQFTVGLHTGQPDGWRGARLIFGLRNNVHTGSRATPNTRRVSVPLDPLSLVVTIAPQLDVHQEHGPHGFVLGTEQGVAWLNAHHQELQQAVDAAIHQRRVNGQLEARVRRWPSEYELPE